MSSITIEINLPSGQKESFVLNPKEAENVKQILQNNKNFCIRNLEIEACASISKIDVKIDTEKENICTYVRCMGPNIMDPSSDRCGFRGKIDPKSWAPWIPEP